tara:strand:+ start:1575 stop:2153 length:579 start_codon:yes stop_codon:yes gene_type:complete
MKRIKIVKIFLILFLIIISILLIFLKIFKKDTKLSIDDKVVVEEKIYSSNIIENVNYSTKDADGNEYLITAVKGEIDFKDPNIIYLTNVKAEIKLNQSDNIVIISDFGKYNTDDFDTIFSKNVIIKYLKNKIVSEYLDFSMNRSTMIISKRVIFTNPENILKADVIEMDLKTKDTKIFMYENNKQINIKNKN